MSSPMDGRFSTERTRMLPNISEEPNGTLPRSQASEFTDISLAQQSNGKTSTPTPETNGHGITREHPFAQSWAGHSAAKSDHRLKKFGDSERRQRPGDLLRSTQSAGINDSRGGSTHPKTKLERRRSRARLAGGSYMHVPIEREELASSHRASREASIRSSRRASSCYINSYSSTQDSVRSSDGTDLQRPSFTPQESVTVIPPSTKEPPIDRGWAWVVMAACCFTFFFGDGIAFTFGVLYPELLKEFGEDNKAQVSLVGSVLTGFYLGPGPIASALGDKLGYRITAITGSILAAASFLAASFSVNVESLIILYGVLGGFGFCLMFVSGMITTSLYFEEKRPIAVGVASCGSGLGIIVFPFILRAILSHLEWRWLLRIEAGILLLGTITALTYCPFPQSEEEENAPKPRTQVSFLKQVAMLIDWKLLKSPVFLLIGATAMFSTIGIATPFFFTTDLAMKQGIEDDKSAFLVSIMGITNTAGRVLIGLIAYKIPISPLLLMAGGLLVGGIATSLSFLYTSYALLAVYCAINGIAYAFDAVLSTEILARTLGRKHLAGAFGLLCLCRGATISVTGPVGGALFDKTMTYNATYFLAGACVLVAAVLTVITFIIVRNKDNEDELNDSQEDQRINETIPEEDEGGDSKA